MAEVELRRIATVSSFGRIVYRSRCFCEASPASSEVSGPSKLAAGVHHRISNETGIIRLAAAKKDRGAGKPLGWSSGASYRVICFQLKVWGKRKAVRQVWPTTTVAEFWIRPSISRATKSGSLHQFEISKCLVRVSLFGLPFLARSLFGRPKHSRQVHDTPTYI